MEEEILPRRDPTPADYRRAATAILFAAAVTAAIGFWFQTAVAQEPGHLAAAWLFWIIAAVDLFVGATVMAYSGRGGSPGARRSETPH